MIPNLDRPICTATSEDSGVESVPPDSIHSHVVSVVSVQVLGAVVFAALVDLALLCPHQEEIVGGLVEVDTRPAR